MKREEIKQKTNIFIIVRLFADKKDALKVRISLARKQSSNVTFCREKERKGEKQEEKKYI